MWKLRNKENKPFITTGVLVLGLVVGLVLIRNPQILDKKAQEPICSVTTAYCRWGKVATATSYGYTILDVSANAVLLRGTTTENQLPFSILSGHTYRCSITPINSCGVGPLKSTEKSCIVSSLRVGGINASPSATLVATPSATLIPEPTLTLVPTIISKVTNSPEPTVAPTLTSEPTQSVILPTSTPKPILSVKTLNSTTKLLSYGTSVVLFICVILIALRSKVAKRRRKESVKGSAGREESKQKRYYLKPYQDDPDSKSMWVTLTQDKTQTLGLCHDETILEGFYEIEGVLKVADSVSYMDISTLVKV